MYASPVMIVNAAGIHARPASELVNYCKQFFNTSIYIINGEKRLNAKSILSGGLKRGLEVTVSAEGENEEVVCKKVIAFIQALE